MRDPRRVIMTISLLASVLMLTGKVTAYVWTHSAAILSDAAESVVHGAATALAAFSLWFASRPADANHPYGHGRIAYFSAGFEGGLVFLASIAVIYLGVSSFIKGPQLKDLGFGLAITGALAAVNLVLGLSLVGIGRRHNSIIVEANGKHVLSDMWTSVAAIVGVGLVMLTGRTWLDPVAAVLIGFYIMASGASLIRKSFAGLMDEVEPEVSQKLLRGLRKAEENGVVEGFHQLRCRRVDDKIWVDVHLLVHGDLSTSEAHRRASMVEQSLSSIFPEDQVHVTSHIEPADHESAHPEGHPESPDPLG